jgi:hypothetical protein
MSLDTSGNLTTLEPENYPDSPSIKVQYHGFILDLGAASDRLLDCFVHELTDRLVDMAETNNKNGWKAGPIVFEYAVAQTRYHLRGLMKEQSRRRDVALRTMPVLVEAG